MTRLSEPLVEARAIAGLIEARAHALATYARTISESPDTDKILPEEWQIFCSSLEKLSNEVVGEVANFADKARYGL
jgi:hypothetical protein